MPVTALPASGARSTTASANGGPAHGRAESFGLLLQRNVPEPTRRTLVLLSKILQNVTSGVQFGGKEAYMEPANQILMEYGDQIEQLFLSIMVRVRRCARLRCALGAARRGGGDAGVGRVAL